MPIRAAVTLAATAIGVVLLFSFRTPPAAPIATLTPSSTSSSTSTPSPTVTPSGAPPSGGASPAPTATATATPAASGLKSGSFTGQTYTNPYGNVQVQVVISGGKITGVKTLQYPNGHQQSVFINSQALPLLEQEVLKAQSAQINVVGGATFTSQGYAESVQSALDAARA
ncbi:MAG: FMN-binding protein [Candidatus Dormibacteria bacterium]|jgi:uncharacterized protein with FMN-binding domain